MPHTLNINGTLVSASHGETLIDAALTSKILIPHDCSSGQCETCRVRVAWGDVEDGGTSYGDTVLACQARVCGDATITFEQAPAVESLTGKLEQITALSSDVSELVVRTNSVLRHRPGQYVKLAFDGYPAREYSLSASMSTPDEPDQLVFHIKRLTNGKVSSNIGNAIRPGHAIKLQGPFGNAYLRKQEIGPLLLTSSGTGFAPIWAVAKAVALANDNRTMALLTGIRSPNDLYMNSALRWLHDRGRKNIIVAARKGANGSIAAGPVEQHLPNLTTDTVVHAAGNPKMVEYVKAKALAANCQCHCDPFVPSSNKLSWRQRLRPLSRISGLLENRG